MILHIGATAQLSTEESDALREVCKVERPDEFIAKLAASTARRGGEGVEEFIKGAVEIHRSMERRSQPRQDSIAQAFSELPRRDLGSW